MNEQTQKQPPRHLVMFLLFVIFVMVNCFFVEGHAYFDEGNRVAMNSVEYLVSILALTLFDGTFYILAVRYFHPKVNWALFIGLMALFFINATAVAFFPGIYDTGDLVYSPTFSERIRSIFSCFFMVFSLYVTLVVAPQIVSDKRTFYSFFLYITINAFVAVIYSYFTEGSLYLFILKNSGPSDSYSVPQSFTTQRNVYAALLFYGLMAQAFLQCKHPHWWRWAIMLFFYVNQFFIYSKTCILLCSLFLAIFGLYRSVATFKKFKVRNSIALGLFVVLFALVVGISLSSDTPYLLPLKNFLDTVMTSIGESFSTRIYNWGDIIRKLLESPITTIFGFGMGLSRESLNIAVYSEAAKDFTPVDNAYVMLWANFGILGLILYAVFLGYLVYRLVKAFQKHSRTAHVSLFILIALLGHSLTEETTFMGFMSTNVVAIFTAVVPLTSEAYEPLYQKEQTSLTERYRNKTAASFVKPELMVREKISIVLKWFTPLVAIFIGVGPMLQMNLPARFHFAYGGLLNEICAAIVFLLLPMVWTTLSSLRKNKSWLRYGLFLGSFALATLLALVAPWTGIAMILEGVSLGLLLVHVVLLAVYKLLPPYSILLKAYWPSLAYLPVVLVLDLGLTYGLGSGTSRYLCLALMMADLFIWWSLLFFNVFPMQHAFEPFWDYIEDKFTFYAFKGRLKEDGNVAPRKEGGL